MNYAGIINAKVKYDRNKPINVRGSNTTRVFKGYFMGHIPIAVKVYPISDKQKIEERQKDFEILYSPENKHRNLILYYGHAPIKNTDGTIKNTDGTIEKTDETIEQ